MSNEQPNRPKRSGSNASPMGSTLAIVIAIAAVVVGFLILKAIRSDDGGAAATTTTPTTSTLPLPAISATTISVAPIVTVFQPTVAGATVLVANSSGINKVAGQLTDVLKGQGFTMEAAADGAGKVKATVIQYADGDAAAQQVAQSVAVLMGVDPATMTVIPTPVLLKDPKKIGAATVVVLLGDDKAGKTLAQMVAPAGTANSTPTVTT
jgi:hypothetical protein